MKSSKTIVRKKTSRKVVVKKAVRRSKKTAALNPYGLAFEIPFITRLGKKIFRKPSVFTVILFFMIIASFSQLSVLQKSFFPGFSISGWYQDTFWKTQSHACSTNCGVGIATKDPTISFTPERVVMNTVHIDLPVVSVPLENGTWDVKAGVANYAEGTSLVNAKSGNVGLFGHAQSNAFLRIKDLKKEAVITVYAKGYTAVYEVTSITKISPKQVEVFYPTKEPVLTLITCDGPTDEFRYMVRAKLVSVKK